VDVGVDFLTPELLNLLFFQQKNLIIFPYVDLKHLHVLEIFAAGYIVVDLESTALHNIKSVLEFESTNSYSQSPTMFFIYNADWKKIQEVMTIDGIRCVVNSNENITEIPKDDKFIFYNKKNNRFLNYNDEDQDLEFEKFLISSSGDPTILQDKIQNIKITASKIFIEINQDPSLENLPIILKSFERSYWQKILDFTSNYFNINLPSASKIKGFSSDAIIKHKQKEDLEDYSEEYNIIVSINKNIGKEFIQLLHDYRSKRVNSAHLELEQLYNPLKLYNYLRNRHWKEGIPESFLKSWLNMEISQYELNDSDDIDFQKIISKLNIQYPISFNRDPIKEPIVTNVKDNKTIRNSSTLLSNIPLVRDFPRFKAWLLHKLEILENLVDNAIDSQIKRVEKDSKRATLNLNRLKI
jgi:hypothetical protein